MRGDDGLGPLIIAAMRKEGMIDTDLVQKDGEGATLIDAWNGRQSVVLVDALSSGKQPGRIHFLDVGVVHIPRVMFPFSSHTFGVAEAIALSRQLGILPPRFVLAGIEGESFALGQGLSLAVQRSVPEFLRLLRERIDAIVHPIPGGG